jgi:hypothetical protein
MVARRPSVHALAEPLVDVATSQTRQPTVATSPHLPDAARLLRHVHGSEGVAS